MPGILLEPMIPFAVVIINQAYRTFIQETEEMVEAMSVMPANGGIEYDWNPSGIAFGIEDEQQVFALGQQFDGGIEHTLMHRVGRKGGAGRGKISQHRGTGSRER